MSDNVQLSQGLLLGFLLVLTRIGSLFAFVPLPGNQAWPSTAKVAFVLAMTFSLFPWWPKVDEYFSLGQLVATMAGEAALGLAIGVLVSMFLESFIFGAQLISVQAGYSYAATIDPTTQTESGVLSIVTQLLGGILFFLVGLDHLLLRAFVHSLERLPPGHFPWQSQVGPALIRFGSEMFVTGLQLAFPVIALLVLTDLCLALLNRLNQQLQILSLSFSLKMLAGLFALAGVLGVLPLLYAKKIALLSHAINALVGK